MKELSRKVVIVGDGMVGKTALLSAYVSEEFDLGYIPTVFETTAKDIELPDGRQITLGLWDTGGQEEFDQIRQLAYPGASLLLLCYAIDCPTSLENVTQKWVSEVRMYCPKVPLLLVGCKSDKRMSLMQQSGTTGTKNPLTAVDPRQAQYVCKQIGADAHIECSAVTRSNVATVFELAARFILDSQAEKPRNSVRRILSFSRDKPTMNGSVASPRESNTSRRRLLFSPKIACLSKNS